MLLRLDPRSGTPLFEQLVFQVKRAVAEGQLAEGDKLPSVRELARELGINPNTVVRAIEGLERDGVIVRRQGSGCFVQGRSQDLAARERRRRLERLFSEAVTEAFHLGFTAEDMRAALEEEIGVLKGRKVQR